MPSSAASARHLSCGSPFNSSSFLDLRDATAARFQIARRSSEVGSSPVLASNQRTLRPASRATSRDREDHASISSLGGLIPAEVEVGVHPGGLILILAGGGSGQDPLPRLLHRLSHHRGERFPLRPCCPSLSSTREPKRLSDNMNHIVFGVGVMIDGKGAGDGESTISIIAASFGVLLATYDRPERV